ncbi:unnamed protein product [Cercospora beticola]|nr:unnamed protein product [Cercospora beticola]
MQCKQVLHRPSIGAYAQSAVPVGSSPVPQGNTVTVSIPAESPAPSPKPVPPPFLGRAITPQCPVDVVGCGQNVTEWITDHPTTTYVTTNVTHVVPQTVTETNVVVTVSVTTKYNTTEGVCSTVIHVPAPVDTVVTVTQNVTSTQWWLEKKTTTRVDTVTVNATSTDACYIPQKSPIGSPIRGSTTILTDQPTPSSEPELVFEDEDGEDHAFHPEI